MPTPAIGPPSPTGNPRPAGLEIPVPACSADGAPPGADVPNLALGSDGGGPSTLHDTIFVPLNIKRPRVRFFSSASPACAAEPGAAGAEGLFWRFLTLRNSSVSARTRFMCYNSRRISSLFGDVGGRPDLAEGDTPCRKPASVRSSDGHHSW